MRPSTTAAACLPFAPSRPALLALALLGACGTPTAQPDAAPDDAAVDEAPQGPADAPEAYDEVAPAPATAIDTDAAAPSAPPENAAPRRAAIPELRPDQRYTVVLVIQGGVGAARVGACGAPTDLSPLVHRLIDEHEAVLGCDVYAPSSWTVPAVRSILKGRSVYHAAPAAEDGPHALVGVMKAAGYQTMLLSADPAMRGAGVEKGFDVVRVAGSRTAMRYPYLSEALEQLLERADADRPLFLVVHTQDASDPLPPVPNKSWGLAQNKLMLVDDDGKPTDAWRRFHADRLPLDERQRFLLRVNQGITRGVELSDDDLRGILEVLQRQGRPMRSMRLVAVGDHGLFGGEHGLLGEASGTWEAGVRVPMLFLDTELHGDDRPDLDGPLSSVVAYDLVARGALPDDAPPVFSVSRAVKEGLGTTMVSAWVAGQPKLTWEDGTLSTYDLGRDAGETSPRSASGHPALGFVREVAGQLSARKGKDQGE
ncbi:MAG: sulfatase-like hydrolase/transferase [Alphaproteobacteria bacterium]|nr:sulfatase-like hydrolase/transferase [Alphaproteobacteria bacterium]